MSKIIITDDALRRAAVSVREAMLSTIPSPEECLHTFSAEFEEKMARLMKAEQRRSHRRSVARRVAAVFLAALIGVSAWLAIDAPARASFFNWVREVYETYIVYRFTGEAPAEALPEYRLGWLPEGYVEVSVSGDESLRNVLYVNSNNGNEGIIFTYHHIHKGTLIEIFDTNGEKTEVLINQLPGHFYAAASEDETNGLVWIDEAKGIAFSISAFLSMEDMLHIAESLYLEDVTK